MRVRVPSATPVLGYVQQTNQTFTFNETKGYPVVLPRLIIANVIYTMISHFSAQCQDVSQLVDILIWSEGVAGSSPVILTLSTTNPSLGQSGRPLALGARCREFESLNSDQCLVS